MTETERKELIKQTFNTVSEGYDRPAMRFFPENAGHMAQYFQLNGSEDILDIATGTGYVAIEVAKKLSDGHVTGVDFSEGMLSEARRKAESHNAKNVTFKCMDIQALDFPSNRFDGACSGFGIFFLEDMLGTLSHIVDKVKVGGKILISTFAQNSFSPLSEMFKECIERYGVEVPSTSWKRLDTVEKNEKLFAEAGLKDVKVHKQSLGYYLKDEKEWWEVLWNAGFRSLINQLSGEQVKAFKEEHLREIQTLKVDKGIWLTVDVLYTLGIK
ncbi:MAG: methyltransferase [bacterium]|nr:MAG: methyltransferase [bacterium]